MGIFVSSQRINASFPSQLVDKLREAGFAVFNSPKNPADGIDEKWKDWYDKGLQSALSKCESFIIVLDNGWDSSTGMAIEAEEALRKFNEGKIKGYYYINPGNIIVKAEGMLPYLRQQLPANLDGIIAELNKSQTKE